MPHLNGKPFKSKLYAEVKELKRSLRVETTEHRKTKQQLRYAQARIEELEVRNQQIMGVASRNVDVAVRKRIAKDWEKVRDAAYAAAKAS